MLLLLQETVDLPLFVDLDNVYTSTLLASHPYF